MFRDLRDRNDTAISSDTEVSETDLDVFDSSDIALIKALMCHSQDTCDVTA